MKDPKDCIHENFAANVAVGRILDAGKFCADITVKCADCGEPFRFVGVDAGFDLSRPMVSIDGLELRAPIEPEIEKKLHDGARFVVPEIPKRH